MRSESPLPRAPVTVAGKQPTNPQKQKANIFCAVRPPGSKVARSPGASKRPLGAGACGVGILGHLCTTDT